ncbi:sla2 Src-like adaptor 2 [Pleurotus pulmonarius]|nr:sla2 Src-like adaptor 2 [Pleurotus pulmonarius]
MKGTKQYLCHISALVPLVKEILGIYRFVTSILKAMLKSTDDTASLEPLRERYASQHRILRKFYDERSKLKTDAITRNHLLDRGDAALQ